MKDTDGREFNNEEMYKLINLCIENQIPCEVAEIWDAPAIIIYRDKEHIYKMGDAVCHRWSYGHENGLLEIMGFDCRQVTCDDVRGWLTAEQVMEIIQKLR